MFFAQQPPRANLLKKISSIKKHIDRKTAGKAQASLKWFSVINRTNFYLETNPNLKNICQIKFLKQCSIEYVL